MELKALPVPVELSENFEEALGQDVDVGLDEASAVVEAVRVAHAVVLGDPLVDLLLTTEGEVLEQSVGEALCEDDRHSVDEDVPGAV